MAYKSIRSKLLTRSLLISIVPLATIILWNFLTDYRNIKNEIFQEITVARDMKQDRIVDYFNDYLRQLEYFTLAKGPINATVELIEAFNQLDPPRISLEEHQKLQDHYKMEIEKIHASGLIQLSVSDWYPEDPVAHVLQYKYLVDSMSYPAPAYERLYEIMHEGITLLADKFQLSDAMLIDNKSGFVVYTQERRLDFGINLNHPRYQDGPLYKVYRKAMLLPKGQSTMTDFSPYKAAFMKARLFLAAPVYYQGESVATLVFQIDNEEINRFMLRVGDWEKGGYQRTQESYVVGEDQLMRSSSRFYLTDQEQFIEDIRSLVPDTVISKLHQSSTTVLTLPIDTEATVSSFSGDSLSCANTKVGIDYRGKKVLNSYTPIDLGDLRWAVVTQIDYEEAFARLESFTIQSMIILIVFVILATLLAIWTTTRFTRPINILMKGTDEVKKDNLNVSLEAVSDDEFGRLTEMFNTMVSSIRMNREELLDLYAQVSEKQKEITDSIHYALRIQHAALPEREPIKEVFDESFVLYRPKDIVSGDYYWYYQLGDKFVMTAADCTGHGVPGSFISLLGIRFLRRAIIDDHITRPDLILARLREELLDFFKREEDHDEIKDGMDLAVCTYNRKTKVLEYAGAMNPLYQMRNGEVNIYKADRMAVSAQASAEQGEFTLHTIPVQENDVYYIFSDGYPDQMGGPRGKKFLSKKFREYLLEIHQKRLAEQNDMLQERLDNWIGSGEQTDDIIVMGFKPF